MLSVSSSLLRLTRVGFCCPQHRSLAETMGLTEINGKVYIFSTPKCQWDGIGLRSCLLGSKSNLYVKDIKKALKRKSETTNICDCIQ